MRPRRAVIVAGTIALLSPMLTLHSRVYAQTEGPMATGKRDAVSGTEAAAASSLKDKNFDPSTISKSIMDESARLKNDASGWSQKLQDLDVDLKKNQQDVEATGKDIDECLVVLRAAKCIPIRRFASSQGFFSRRPPNCALSTGQSRKRGRGWSRR